MKNELTRHDIAVRKEASKDAAKEAAKDARVNAWTASRCVRLGLVGSLGASLALMLNDNAPRAQQRYTEPTVKVTSVTSSGNVVSISADSPLNRAQLWQDPEGFHVVLVNGQTAGGVGAGVKTRRVGNSLELVVPVRRGASVTVEPRGNRLDLVVSGGQAGALNVENFPIERQDESKTRARASESRESEPREQEATNFSQPSQRKRNQPEPSQAESQQSYSPQQFPAPAQSSKPAPNAATNMPTAAQPPAPAPASDVNPATVLPPAPQTQTEPNSSNVPDASAQLESSGGFSFYALLTSVPGLLLLAGALIAGTILLFLRRRRDGSDNEESVSVSSSKRREAVSASSQTEEAESDAKPFKHFMGDRRRSSVTVPFERRKMGRGSEDSAFRQQLDPDTNNLELGERTNEARPPVAVPAVQFGAYRIDQEVASLVEGKPHSLEVIASRASDDRRAVETSLLKALRSPETNEDGRRRVRSTLEDYGFVARSCASLLLGSESFERASAARSLGEMRSAQALPFLTEALYDQDPVVRNACVESLGALGLPSAIGALLDVARRHPDLSSNILGPALTACSVESLELSWDSPFDSRTFAEGHDVEEFSRETVAIMAAESYEELPDYIEDAMLESALGRVNDEYAESRVVAAQSLAQFQVRRAVEALSLLARQDSEPAVRSTAVTSLGLINHESVFVHVIAALADDAREVRAAAARAMSRLSFDRADAYVRVIESADASALRDVAQAAVKAGLAAQAISRLGSEDRRQAYEAFSLLSLCAKAGEVHQILDTIECHRDIEVRMTCIRLLGLSFQPETVEQLMRIAGNGGVPERVRRAIVETVENGGQTPTVVAQTLEVVPVEFE